MSGADEHPFLAWLKRWMDLARYTGTDVPDPLRRTEDLIALWNSDIPGGWHRGTDNQVIDPTVRYRRGEAQGPRAGSEHALEYEILSHDPSVTQTRCFGHRLIDGVNAVPLARDPNGRRRAGNVEADMLLLTADGEKRQLVLVEAKTISNNAWYAAIENLRQLRLFQASDAAQAIMQRRSSDRLPVPVPVTGAVLAPAEFYAARGARRRSVAPTQAMSEQLANRLGLDVRLAVWDGVARTITHLPSTK
jgi:hypothetical protein